MDVKRASIQTCKYSNVQVFAAGVDDLDLAAEGVEDGFIDRGVGVDGLDQFTAGIELVGGDFAELVGDGGALAFGIVGEGNTPVARSVVATRRSRRS